MIDFFKVYNVNMIPYYELCTVMFYIIYLLYLYCNMFFVFLMMLLPTKYAFQLVNLFHIFFLFIYMMFWASQFLPFIHWFVQFFSYKLCYF